MVEGFGCPDFCTKKNKCSIWSSTLSPVSRVCNCYYLSHFQFLTNYAQNNEEKPKQTEETISKLKREKIKNQAKNSKKSWLIDHYSNLQYFPHFLEILLFADAVKQTRSISIHPHAIFLSRRIQAGSRYSIYLSRHI